MLGKLLIWLGLAPSMSDKKLTNLVRNSYKNINVVGRGTVRIDPKEVISTDEFKAARQRAKEIVSKNY